MGSRTVSEQAGKFRGAHSQLDNGQATVTRNIKPSGPIDLREISTLDPQHVRASSALLFKPATLPPITQSRLQEIADDSYDIEFTLDEIEGDIRAEINRLTAMFANQNLNNPFDRQCAMDFVTTELVNSELVQETLPEEVIDYTRTAIGSVLEAYGENLIVGLSDNIYNDTLFFQHCGFLKGVAWPALKPVVQQHLISKYVKQELHFDIDSEEIEEIIQKHIDNAKGYDNKFKAFKHSDSPRLRETQIRSPTNPNKIFALIKTPTHEQLNRIRAQFPEAAGMRVLGKGGFREVKYGFDLETDEVIAFKEIKSCRAAINEVKEFQRVGSGKHLISMRGFVHTPMKSYIAMDYGGSRNGDSTRRILREIRKTSPDLATLSLKVLAEHYLLAVSELHDKGIYHHDLKPANFVHRANWVYVADYGFCGTEKNNIPGGTRTYFPPETKTRLYRSGKHDAFSLGLTLLSLKLGYEPYRLKDNHLTINGKSFTLKFDQSHRCCGTNGTLKLAGNTLDEVIAKLLDSSPHKRISVKDALQLPFFTVSNHPNQANVKQQ